MTTATTTPDVIVDEDPSRPTDAAIRRHQQMMQIAAYFSINEKENVQQRIKSEESALAQQVSASPEAQRRQMLTNRIAATQQRLAEMKAAHERAEARHHEALGNDDESELASAREAMLSGNREMEVTANELDVLRRLHSELSAQIKREHQNLLRVLHSDMKQRAIVGMNETSAALWKILSGPDVQELLRKLIVETGVYQVSQTL